MPRKKIAAGALADVISQHELWVQSDGKEGARADLSLVDMAGTDLSGTDMFRAVFVGAVLSDADLVGVNLARADLRDAVLVRATLASASLQGANLAGAALDGANLRGADLRGAKIEGCKIDAVTVETSAWPDAFVDNLLDRGARAPEELRQRVMFAPVAEPADFSYRPYPRALVDELDSLTVQLHQAELAEARDEAMKYQAAIHTKVAELAPYRPPRAGDIVLGARLVRVVGSGSFGHVWLAELDGPGVDRGAVAIKVIDSNKVGLRLTLHYFRRGVDAMQHLNSVRGCPPTVVELLQADDAHLAFSMPYYEKIDLAKTAARRWELSTKINVFRQVCEAVDFAHKNDVRHRDIKPENILVSSDKPPKAVLTDFDIADLLFRQTMSALEAGSVLYAAPEQLARAVDPTNAVDLYSLGRVLHFLLLGTNPPYGGEPVPVLADLTAQPVGLVRMIRKCTLRNPAERYQSVSELVADLDRFDADPEAVGVGVEVSPVTAMHASNSPGSVAPTSRESLLRNGPVVTAVGGVLAALVAGAFGLMEPRAGDPQDRAQSVAAPQAGDPRHASRGRGRTAPARATAAMKPARTPLTAPPPGAIETEKGRVWLVPIPGGSFTMGSPGDEPGRRPNEEQHEETVSSFLIGWSEVTNEQYARYLAANPDVPEPSNWNAELPPTHPVVGVTWHDAYRFAEWTGGRLPTEAEWERAARAGVAASRHGKLDTIAWHWANRGKTSEGGVQQVCVKVPNGYGLCDVLGNAAEWVATEAAAGAVPSRECMIRGGSWINVPELVRSATRTEKSCGNRDAYIGFRIARDLAPL